MNTPGKQTHLYQFHRETGKIVDFTGFKMPIWYRGIIPEHLAVRHRVGIFDVTHMGRVIITGSDVEAFLNHVTTNNVAALAPLAAHYSVMCNEKGGIKDDFVLSQLEKDKFFMVYNAANRTKNYEWLRKQAIRFEVEIEDVSDQIAMFAVQGPQAQTTLQKLASEDLHKIKRFKCGWTRLSGVQTFISRTGYTGEDGFEVFVWNAPISNPAKAITTWNAILEAGKEFNIEPCGLGARDTLRLEAGMCLYGNDLDEATTPFEARIGFVVKLQKENFIGKDALAKQKAEGVTKTRIGLQMLEPGIPRPEHPVFKVKKQIGHVTSGTYSPLLKQGIAMAYVQKDQAVKGDTVTIQIREKEAKAEIVNFPFYDATRYGSRRKRPP